MRDDYLRARRHVLLDMHIPDWSEGFLRELDADAYAAACARANADAVTIYCNSHTGHCLWPTATGTRHAGLRDRDYVGEAIAAVHDRGMLACGYFSVVFNDVASREHPEWRIEFASRLGIFGEDSRVGTCCPNNPEFVRYMVAQVEELASGYEWDAFFFDIVMWPGICVCHACRDRYRREHYDELPDRVDWTSRSWGDFQSARQRWLAETFRSLRQAVERHREIPVFLNTSSVSAGWITGGSRELIALSDIVGGDFASASLFTRFAALGSTVQYMIPISGYAGGMSQFRSVEDQVIAALTAVAFGAQFTVIDAIEPSGRFNESIYAEVGRVFGAMADDPIPLGSAPIFTIAVYWDPDSDVDLDESGRPLSDFALGLENFDRSAPHSRAADGAIRGLTRAHLPVGVITRADLGRLHEFDVLILPNLICATSEETDAFRDYVENGGRLYASADSTRILGDGAVSPPVLGDVFGCVFGDRLRSSAVYLKPTTSALSRAIEPVDYVAQGEPWQLFAEFARPVERFAVEASADSAILATIVEPYEAGRDLRAPESWASAFTSPPWEETPAAAIVRHRFGRGEAIYSAFALESAAGAGHEWGGIRSSSSYATALFVALIESLLPGDVPYRSDAHPSVLIRAYRDPETSRTLIALLDTTPVSPSLTVPAFEITIGRSIAKDVARGELASTGSAIPIVREENGDIRVKLDGLTRFDVLLLHSR